MLGQALGQVFAQGFEQGCGVAAAVEDWGQDLSVWGEIYKNWLSGFPIGGDLQDGRAA